MSRNARAGKQPWFSLVDCTYRFYRVAAHYDSAQLSFNRFHFWGRLRLDFGNDFVLFEERFELA